MAGAECHEYEVLIRHTVDLQLAVKANLTPLGAQLVAAKIITLDQYEEIRNAYRPVNDRAADLVGYVQHKVRQEPQHYHDFIGALRSDQSQYHAIMAKLEQSYNRDPLTIGQQPVITQRSLREGSSRLPTQGIILCSSWFW